MEVIPASHGVSGLVFLKLGIIKKKLKLSKEVFEEENNIYYHEEDYKKVRSRNFITLIPFPSIRRMKVNYSGFKFEKFLPNIWKRKSLSCVHVPHKTKIRTFDIVFELRIRRQLNSVLTHFLFRVVPL